jgi:hypothetical protein
VVVGRVGSGHGDLLLDASRSHTVPQNHYRSGSRGVLVVDRYAAYIQGDELGQGRSDSPGLLLVPCAAGLSFRLSSSPELLGARSDRLD